MTKQCTVKVTRPDGSVIFVDAGYCVGDVEVSYTDVDLAAPTVKIDAAIAGAQLDVGKVYTFNAIVDDSSDFSSGIKDVKFYVDDVLYGPGTKSSETVYSASITFTAAGPHTVKAQVTDNAGFKADSTPVSISAVKPVVSKIANAHGENYKDPILSRKQASPAKAADLADPQKYIPMAKQKFKANALRVPVYMEAWKANPTVFKAQMRNIASVARDNGCIVVFDNHHWYTTSAWGTAKRSANDDSLTTVGLGFPAHFVANYKVKKDANGVYDPASDPAVKAFWNALLTNTVNGVNNAWAEIAAFFTDMIEATKEFENVVGFEIINEPWMFQQSNYVDLGKMHTYIATQMRKVMRADQMIFFTRETGHQGFKRMPDQEWNILPKDPAKKVVYMPHVYSTNVDLHITQFLSAQDKWKSMGYSVPIAIGETANQPPQADLSQANTDLIIGAWAKRGWLWFHWAYHQFTGGLGNVVMLQDGTLTEAGKYLQNTINKYY